MSNSNVYKQDPLLKTFLTRISFSQSVFLVNSGFTENRWGSARNRGLKIYKF